MERLKLSPPWDIYYSEVKALFEQDPEVVEVKFDNDDHKLVIGVSNPEKADAIEKILPAVVEFGNVKVTISVQVFTGETATKESKLDLFEKAFKGNPVFSEIIKSDKFEYCGFVVFKKEVVQFYTDDLSTPDGFRSTLYEDIARDVFGVKHDNETVYFSTARE